MNQESRTRSLRLELIECGRMAEFHAASADIARHYCDADVAGMNEEFARWRSERAFKLSAMLRAQA